jgi:hypothetical protein
MRLVTVCDNDGSILAIMTSPEGGLRPSIPSLPFSQQEVEIDAPDITDDLDDAELNERLAELASRCRVDRSTNTFIER